MLFSVQRGLQVKKLPLNRFPLRGCCTQAHLQVEKHRQQGLVSICPSACSLLRTPGAAITAGLRAGNLPEQRQGKFRAGQCQHRQCIKQIACMGWCSGVAVDIF